MAIRVCVAGVSGKTGGEVARAMLASPEFDLTGAIARRSAGRDAGELLGVHRNGTVVSATLEEALADLPMSSWISPAPIRSSNELWKP